MSAKKSYPASLDIDYPKKLDRLSTFFRIIWAIPIILIMILVSAPGSESFSMESSNEITQGGLGIAGGLFFATMLMIVFRQKYPRWWFDFNLEYNRFSTRVGAYLLLMTDKYPSTEDKQSVKLDIVYPDVKRDLNKWLPLVKWFLAIPHYVALVGLMIGVLVVTVIAWFSIILTGKYPRDMFDYVVGVGRWSLRVTVYAFLLTTDEYPPFSLK